MSVFDCLCIKHIYSNPYYPKGNSKIENVHNFLKHTIVKFIYGSQLEWDDVLPLGTCCYNITQSLNDLESPFYLIHGRHPLEGRLSNLQSYCRYIGDQPGQLAVQELWKMWKLHAKFLAENRSIEPVANKQVTKVSDLKVEQLVFVKDQGKGTFDPSYVFSYRVAGIVNDSAVLVTTLDGKEKRCNIHHIKLTIALEASTSVLKQFQESIQKDTSSIQICHSYNLHSEVV